MISALLMLRRLAAALRVASRDEDFGRVLSARLLLIITGTLAYSLGAGWSVVDGLYVAVATLTTSSILARLRPFRSRPCTTTDPIRRPRRLKYRCLSTTTAFACRR